MFTFKFVSTNLNSSFDEVVLPLEVLDLIFLDPCLTYKTPRINKNYNKTKKVCTLVRLINKAVLNERCFGSIKMRFANFESCQLCKVCDGDEEIFIKATPCKEPYLRHQLGEVITINDSSHLPTCNDENYIDMVLPIGSLTEIAQQLKSVALCSASMMTQLLDLTVNLIKDTVPALAFAYYVSFCVGDCNIINQPTNIILATARAHVREVASTK